MENVKIATNGIRSGAVKGAKITDLSGGQKEKINKLNEEVIEVGEEKLDRIEKKVDRILELLEGKDSSTSFEMNLIKTAEAVNSELDRMYEKRQLKTRNSC